MKVSKKVKEEDTKKSIKKTKTNFKGTKNCDSKDFKQMKSGSVFVNNKRSTKVKRKTYSELSLKNAVEAVQTGMSIRKAAHAYGVPDSTLGRKKIHKSSSQKKVMEDQIQFSQKQRN